MSGIIRQHLKTSKCKLGELLTQLAHRPDSDFLFMSVASTRDSYGQRLVPTVAQDLPTAAK